MTRSQPDYRSNNLTQSFKYKNEYKISVNYFSHNVTLYIHVLQHFLLCASIIIKINVKITRDIYVTKPGFRFPVVGIYLLHLLQINKSNKWKSNRSFTRKNISVKPTNVRRKGVGQGVGWVFELFIVQTMKET